MRLLLKIVLVALFFVSTLQSSAVARQNDDINLGRWVGDLDGMLERRIVRVLVPYSRTGYFIDGGTQRGMNYEIMAGFEEYLNDRHAEGLIRINVVFIPTTRDRLIPALEEGLGDIVAANLTVTDERAELIDFTVPLGRNVRELLVRHVDAPAPESLADLAGQSVFVPPSSSYVEHLRIVNAELSADALAPITIREAPGHFQTEDALEMVNAGLVEYTIADGYLANFWQQVLPNLVVHEDIAVSEGNDIAYGIRGNSPQLAAELNEYLASVRKGTLMGNILFKRYLEETQFVTSATDEAARERLQEVAKIFQRHAENNDLNWLMLAAQSYQESRLDHSVVSPVGAIGIMQLLPSTGQDMGVEDITILEANIKAGARYVRYLKDEFFDDPAIDQENQLLFALASYNAGPGRIRSLRREAAERGLDPNRWFNHVEQITAERVGRETVTYVSNIAKYYVAYQLAFELPTSSVAGASANLPDGDGLTD
ncbi:MAG: transporter substrate-binding domain-containing protein [Wenzhouxiangella sp.]|jgi:membrane-bound lytic murein transglycosylase MltF|nr:transporter substrate-binding domain-containing protein [Wenzhouxiangella sp.]